jgi:hypothetical protein
MDMDFDTLLIGVYLMVALGSSATAPATSALLAAARPASAMPKC